MTAVALGRVVVAALFGALPGCGGHGAPDAGGDAQRGAEALRQYGCGTCHRIPGIAGADGNVGPPLERMARRVYLAGVLANTPENMMRWIQAPQQIAPLTAMPNMHVTPGDARDMTTYLYRN